MNTQQVNALLFTPLDAWTLPAKGNYPEKEMYTVSMYDIDHNEFTKFNVERDLFDSFQIPDTFFLQSFAAGKLLPVVTLTWELVDKGRVIVKTLTKIEKSEKKMQIK